MKKLKKFSIILLLFVIALLFNVNKVEAATNIPKVQNVKVSYKDDGRIYVTWDKPKFNLNLRYGVTYYKKGEGIPGWSYVTSSNNMYLYPSYFDIGYNYYVVVRAETTVDRKYKMGRIL